MGVAPYKTFTFDGVSSADYDVYLTGVGVYNAPKRSVEMFSIAGRNGDYALDQGKFENVSVTYKVGMYDTDENNFATKVSNFRNWLCSKVGYVRLEDEYNPNEYRMAVYADGFELDHDMLIAGEAEIEFNCKPQRWLTSGETETAVANNGTLSNPTLFESEPLLAVKGYGNIGFNGYSIDIENVPIGDIQLVGDKKYSSPIVLDLSNANTSDVITVNMNYMTFGVTLQKSGTTLVTNYVSDTLADSNSSFATVFDATANTSTKSTHRFRTTATNITFNKGTSGTKSDTVSGTVTVKYNNTNYTINVSVSISIAYDGTDTITMTISGTATSTIPVDNIGITGGVFYITSISVDSTVSAITDTVYIDCDIGECYLIRNGEIVSMNQNIDLGSDLPTLASGTNTFNYDNTITSFKVTPNWWKV